MSTATESAVPITHSCEKGTLIQSIVNEIFFQVNYSLFYYENRVGHGSVSAPRHARRHLP